MATRSTIAFHNSNTNRVEQIYCHFDGYFEGVGQTLQENYNDSEAAASIVVNGDMSYLSETVDSTMFYHRDRGDKWMYVRPEVFDNMSHYINSAHMEEYNYLFTDNKWNIVINGTIIPLNMVQENNDFCENTYYTIDVWKKEVLDNKTRLGYQEWVDANTINMD